MRPCVVGVAAAAVVLQATSGIIAAGVLRYVDNIADLFAHAGAMFITAVMSYLFFELEPSAVFCAGMFISIAAFFVYYSERVMPHVPAQCLRLFGFHHGGGLDGCLVPVGMGKHADGFGDMPIVGKVGGGGGGAGGRAMSPGDDL